MRTGVFLLTAALLTGAAPLLAQTTKTPETTPTPETTKTIWYDSAAGARHFKIEQTSTNSDGAEQKTVQYVFMKNGAAIHPASVMVSDSVNMQDVLIQADDEGKVVRLQRLVAPNAAGVTWAADSTTMIHDVIVNIDVSKENLDAVRDALQADQTDDDSQIQMFGISSQSDDNPQIQTFDISSQTDDNSQIQTFDIFNQSDAIPQIVTVDIRGEEGGEGQVVVRDPAQLQTLNFQNAKIIRVEGGEGDVEAQIEKLMQELKARDGELKKALETTPESGKMRKEIRIVRRSLDSARMLMDVARGEVAQFKAHFKCIDTLNSIHQDGMKQEERRFTARFKSVCVVNDSVAVAPVPPLPPLPPDAPVPPLPPDADVLIKAFHTPQMVMVSGDSVSIVEEKNGERVVRVFELGSRDTTLVINETDRDGTHRTITLFNGPLTMMNAGSKSLRVICMKGDSMIANVDQKVIVIGPRYAQAKEMLEEVNTTHDAPEVVAKPATPASAAGYMLHDAMPNPASGTVTVNFTLPEASQATLQLYDANGAIVKTMAEGSYAEGDHTVTFDTADLSSGTYFYRLTSGDFVQSKALQVVK